MSISSVEEVIKDLKAGKMIILVDDANRENEGDLAIAAEAVTPESVNFSKFTPPAVVVKISLTVLESYNSFNGIP